MSNYKIEDISVGDIFFRVYKPIDFDKKEFDTEFKKYEVSGVFKRSIELREITPAGRKKTSFRLFLKEGVFGRFDGTYHKDTAIMIGLLEWCKNVEKPQSIKTYEDEAVITTVKYRKDGVLFSVTEFRGSVVFTRNGYQLTGEYWGIFDLIKGIQESVNWKINE